MTTPIYALPDWAAAMASPWNGENQAKRILEAVARGSVLDRDLTAPPGTCDDGAAYLVDATATGLWATHDGDMAVAVGEDAASGWIFIPIASEGKLLYVEDEAILIQYVSAAWAEFAGGGSSGPAEVITESGTSADLDPADEGKYQRWTNTSAKSLTVRDEADVALPDGGEWHIRNVGASDLTLIEDTSVTIHPPADGTLVIPTGGAVTIKRAAADEFDLLGQTVADVS